MGDRVFPKNIINGHEKAIQIIEERIEEELERLEEKDASDLFQIVVRIQFALSGSEKQAIWSRYEKEFGYVTVKDSSHTASESDAVTVFLRY